MARMQWSFEDVYKKVSEFIGEGSAPAGTVLTKVKNLTYRGYIAFLMPVHPETHETYTWSYLRKEGHITFLTGDWEYVMPIDFDCMLRKPEFDAVESRYSALTKVSESIIMRHRNATVSTSYPREYAIRTGPYGKGLGYHTKEMILYPTPGSTYGVNFTYSFIPEKPTETTDYFIGGVLEAETIMECALAAAEFDDDETIDGVHARKANDLLIQLMKKDEPTAPDTVGMVRDSGLLHLNNSALRHGVIASTLTEAYGYTDVHE